MVVSLRRSLLSLAALALLVASFGATQPVRAAEDTVVKIPITALIYQPVGTMEQVASVNVNPDLIGLECSVATQADNQGSVHPGNNLIVTSGENMVVLEDVERAAGAITSATSVLQLADTVTVTLEMGSDEIFSANMTLSITCEGLPQDVQVCRNGDIITIKEDEVLVTDDDPTACEEVATVKVCRDNEVVVIKVTEKRDTDGAVAGCGEKISVCRNNKVVKIAASEKRDTDGAVVGCGQNNDASSGTSGKSLPNTGPTAIAAGLIGSGALGLSVRQWLSSREALRDQLLRRHR